jgi:dephospho-CoA kinase
MQSSGNNREEYEKRMARQLSPEEKARRATYVIHNDGSMEELRQAVIVVYNKLIQT